MIKKEDLTCWKCGSSDVRSIDSSLHETSRPYKIYMCLNCGRIFYKYLDEEKNG